MKDTTHFCLSKSSTKDSETAPVCGSKSAQTTDNPIHVSCKRCARSKAYKQGQFPPHCLKMRLMNEYKEGFELGYSESDTATLPVEFGVNMHSYGFTAGVNARHEADKIATKLMGQML